MSRIKTRYPTAKLGAELIFRGGQLRALDAALPKDVWLMNMVNWDGETAMSDFANISGRELIVWPRITDDGGELNIQLNAMMYDHEETITESVPNGLTGVLGQLNKARGAEASAQYIAEGAWNPQISCQSFYDRYLRRLFGTAALDELLKAYLLLEENEKTLGWHGRRGLFGTYHHGNRMGVALDKSTTNRRRSTSTGRKWRRTSRPPNKSATFGTVARRIVARHSSCCDKHVPTSCPARARNWIM